MKARGILSENDYNTLKKKMQQPINLLEYETLASQYLPKMAFDYYASGAWDEITLRDNREAFNRYKLRPKMLVDVSQRDMSTTICGKFIDLPILIPPMAFQCLADPEGELITAKVAATLHTIMILSTMATMSLEDVALVSRETRHDANLWFQLYVHRDRALTRELVTRAEAAGYQALCLTVDAPLLGKRERDRRNQFTLPPELTLANLVSSKYLKIPQTQGESGLFTYFAEQLDPS